MYPYNDFPSQYYLAHHGVKGQKWYIRRYQNEDGTLTPLGKKHYAIKDYRQAKRHTAAVGKEYRDYAKLYQKYDTEAKAAESNLQKYTKKPKLFQDKDVVKNLMWESAKADLYRHTSLTSLKEVESVYSDEVKNFRKSIIEANKYKSVKDLKTKDMKIGKGYVAQFAKTGPTVSDIPLIGPYYSGKYTEREVNKRRKQT